MKRCLLIQTSFIGDVVLASSMLETLHRSDQRIQLDLLVRKGNESLFNGHPYLNELLIWDKKSGKYYLNFDISTYSTVDYYRCTVDGPKMEEISYGNTNRVP